MSTTSVTEKSSDCQNVDPEAAPTSLYSAFTKPQKRLILLLVALSAMFSPLSSFIYFPATTALAHALDRTVEAINLSITTYMVVSGVAPAIIGDAADKLGRRLVFLAAIAIYLVANIGLALQSNYAALLVLRAVQSLGSAGMLLDHCTAHHSEDA